MSYTESTSELKRQTVTSCEKVAPESFVIGYKRQHDFEPGQALKLSLSHDTPPRIYSICSGSQDDEIRILFNIKYQGLLTPALATLSPGDSVLASAPYGTFAGTTEPAWWIATGTGIAPFHSMLRSDMGDGKTVVHGVRYLNQFYFEQEFASQCGARYHQCCSAEASVDTYHGRVTQFLEAQVALPHDQRYYICGQTGMAVEVRDILIAKGIPFGKISTEIYF